MFITETEHGSQFWNENHFVPHFQPIVNAINRSISAYEVLGRQYDPEAKTFHSLGGLFHSREKDMVPIYNIDRILREKAIQILKDSQQRTKLFFNMMPNFLNRVHKEDLFAENFHIIQLIETYGIDRNQVVIEITEDEFEGSIERLIQIVQIFRDYGLKIAIDDLGTGFSNLERIGYLHPDIMKVDIKIMRESLNKNSFKQVLGAISEMSQKLGSQLLFEGIETEEEVNLALSMGANLLQGFYFSQPNPNFLNRNTFSEKMSIILENFTKIRSTELREKEKREKEIIDHLQDLMQGFTASQEDEFVSQFGAILKQLPKSILKVFVCDKEGYQITPTYDLDRFVGGYHEKLNQIGNNYAWKPYFLKHQAESDRYHKKWGVTYPLYDIRNQNQYVIFTFSLPGDRVLIAQVDWSD
ncbi:signal transduction protein [Leptospira ryugenii]|uniref:Signal transduction protein n=1 Tax=Leptospira ryugenii TaxID=1917863 RepID=A0A2P2DWD2_9LEPT|nr:EAL domain-containing protein [Leptospira ryugenii]GBF48926.1 signal transduction protein [Leptospira ryugenii]